MTIKELKTKLEIGDDPILENVFDTLINISDDENITNAELMEYANQDTHEVADYLGTTTSIDDLMDETRDKDYWREQALHEYGFEGCGSTMAGVDGIAVYLYWRDQLYTLQYKLQDFLHLNDYAD